MSTEETSVGIAAQEQKEVDEKMKKEEDKKTTTHHEGEKRCKKGSLTMTDPHRIFEHLNGVIVGHYVMKKALSVSVYNHYMSCCGGTARDTLRCESEEDDLDGPPPPPRRRSYTGESLVQRRGSNASNASSSRDLESITTAMSPINEGTFLSPIVARVIIEASSHKVHLRKSNTLTFDPTGSGVPLGVIARTVAQYLGVPYFRCDCRTLVPSSRRNRSTLSRRPSLFDDAFSVGSTVNEVFSSGLLNPPPPATEEEKRAARARPVPASRLGQAIVFLDFMDQIGINADNTEDDTKEILRELTDIIDGTSLTLTHASKPSSSSASSPPPPPAALSPAAAAALTGRAPAVTTEVGTDSMFFICFGVNESCNSLHSSVEDAAEKRRPSNAASTTSMETSSSSNGPSNHSSHGLPKVTVTEYRQRRNAARRPKWHPSTPSTDSTNSSSGLYDEEDLLSEDDDEYESEEEGVLENRMAKLLVEGKNSPIPHYLDLWGLKDVDFRVCPEALEVIANQAEAQHAGPEGVTTILEKLLFTVKFELPPASSGRVKAIEISEDCVLGKEPPVFVFFGEGEEKEGGKEKPPRRTPSYAGLSEAAVNVSHKLRKVSSMLTDFDNAVMEDMEI